MVSSMLSDMASRDRVMTLEQQLLHSLNYHRMRDRRQRIVEAHEGTLGWIFDKTGQGSRPGSDLNYWLTWQHGLYWLSGKAGSGKSTLMKFLQSHRQTRKALKIWAKNYPIVIASFYFWSPGIAMQKSQLGLLQSLMYEIVQQCPELIPTILPMRWRSYALFGGDLHSWTLPELYEAFDLLGTQETTTARFCFFIDGLDEFDGKHSDIVKTITAMSNLPNIKICASSRPWNVFEDAFANCPKLLLQDLNRRDIEAYVNLELNRNKQFSLLRTRETASALLLVSEIVDKSSGVFLWVTLVLQSLQEGLSNADRISNLQARLRALPADLEPFFIHMLKDTNGLYLTQATQLFRLVLEAQTPLSLLTLSYFDEEDPEFPFTTEVRALGGDEVQTRCQDMRRRLQSRCKGLLEARKSAGFSIVTNDVDLLKPANPAAVDDGMEIDFLHRTVRDFLNTPAVDFELVAVDSEFFNANITLLRAFIARVKGLSRSGNRQASMKRFWSLVGPAVYHARIAEENTGISQSRLLNELDRAASLFYTSSISQPLGRSHWSNSASGNLRDQSATSFLTFAIEFGLERYVAERLESDATLLSSNVGRPLLLFAFSGRSSLLKPDSSHSRDSGLQETKFTAGNSLETPNLGMIRMLLERGADPNKYHGGQTVWESVLQAIDQRAKPFSTQEEWADTARLFISHGADPKVRVSQSEMSVAEAEVVQLQGKSAADIMQVAFAKHLSDPLVDLMEDIWRARNRRENWEENQKSTSVAPNWQRSSEIISDDPPGLRLAKISEKPLKTSMHLLDPIEGHVSTRFNTRAQAPELPLPASTHGTKIVNVHVGSGSIMQIYSIHKSLLCTASDYFIGALAGSFEESSTQVLELKRDCPIAFEVLYQWLYSGAVHHASFYTQSRITDDVLWLRVYKLANASLVDKLQEVAYSRLRDMFNMRSKAVPSLQFIEELYEHEEKEAHEHIKDYTVAHTAFWIRQDNQGGWQEWKEVLEKKSRFGVAVAVHLAKLHSSDFDGCRSHPAGDGGSQFLRPWVPKLGTRASPSKVDQKNTTGQLAQRLHDWLAREGKGRRLN
jgi:hypothetical protein